MPNEFDNFNYNNGSSNNSGYGQYYNNQNSYNNDFYNQSSYDPYGNTAVNSYGAGVSRGARYSMKDVMARTFLFMTVALLLTAIVALAVYTTNPYFLLFGMGGHAFIILIIAEFAVVIGATFAIKANNTMLSGVLFIAYSIINGLTLSVIFLVYAESSIAKVFFLTAGLFGVMAVIGFTTDRDLTSFGSLLMIGLFGIIFASIINFFLKSSGLDYLITILGIAIFLGLTAYDTQKIKNLASNNPGYSLTVIALYGALELYLDFINLFLKLLRLLGKAKN
ncbi:hypothetical protein SAMN04487934_10955 [Eubacterium ruminantium]|nr:hypothetical protein SAMN04487934_10955 [Eubacterium ruminantium]